jgi:hypothetical protein
MQTNYFKRLIICGVLAGLAACGGTSEDDNTVQVAGINVKSTINKTGSYNVEITGSNNEVTITAGNKVGRLDIAGINHDVWIQAGAEVDSIDIEGSDNTVHVPAGFKTKLTKSGSNNNVEEG